ncbi:GNAT family N-acetyltransferase [Planomonospora venezuelensis]|uniref:GNAT superfamily N-acetyltransferase n=1 Tax=Planomonospora venezuelensis TaxID=1999 RepID=A0A841DFU5_PLAVE|nr:GNAT family N-acetyltransferase [Planomonospora venezuelensis]MBB5966106.1 GNAT superfamily N-acetyltransferase [Planomonospora venezuelensis]GIN04646.1 hypothetical protein Pve01_63040 [Planomonospora venezuelensis]
MFTAPPAPAPIRLRPLAHGETGPVLEVFAGMSPHSRFLRFLAPMPRLPGFMLRVLAGPDQDGHVALVAHAGDRAVGIGRYVVAAEPARAFGGGRQRRTAEVAFSVVDDYQGRGVGRMLLDALVAHAAERGIGELVFTVHRQNRRALNLLRSAGAVAGLRDGLVEGRLPTGCDSLVAAF